MVGLHETMDNEGSKILAERFDAFLLDNAHASEVARRSPSGSSSSAWT